MTLEWGDLFKFSGCKRYVSAARRQAIADRVSPKLKCYSVIKQLKLCDVNILEEHSE